MKKRSTGTVTRQALYLAILISVTAGFISGAAYTSFKLADETSRGIITPMPSSGGQVSGPGVAAAGVDARVAELKAFLAQHPEDAGAWARLGHLFFDGNRFSEAIEAYQKSLALGPGNPAVMTDMGVMYRRSGDPEKAIRAFDQAVAASPGFEAALFNKGVVLMADMNDLKGAMAAWEELVKVNPDATTPGGEKLADIVTRMKQQKN